jgi:hypothetical protein
MSDLACTLVIKIIFTHNIFIHRLFMPTYNVLVFQCIESSLLMVWGRAARGSLVMAAGLAMLYDLHILLLGSCYDFHHPMFFQHSAVVGWWLVPIFCAQTFIVVYST